MEGCSEMLVTVCIEITGVSPIWVVDWVGLLNSTQHIWSELHVWTKFPSRGGSWGGRTPYSHISSVVVTMAMCTVAGVWSSWVLSSVGGGRGSRPTDGQDRRSTLHHRQARPRPARRQSHWYHTTTVCSLPPFTTTQGLSCRSVGGILTASCYHDPSSSLLVYPSGGWREPPVSFVPKLSSSRGHLLPLNVRNPLHVTN